MRPTILVCSLALVLAAPAVLAQPPAETCGAGDSLSGSDALPQNLAASASVDDLDMSGTGCNEQGFDHVTCFVPTTDCTVVAACLDATLGTLVGLQFSISAFQGTCTTSPASCLDSSQGTGASGQISVALTGGQNYCFVCEVGNPSTLGLTLATAGDCGALPVELESFAVDD